MEKGQLDRENDSSLFIDYLDSEVQEAMNNFEEEMGCKILKLNNTLYLLPDHDNSLLGFRNKDFKEWLGSGAKLNDIYLSYYITMFIFYKFYSGKNKNPKQREFLGVMTLIEDLDQRFQSILAKDDVEISEIEEELGINLVAIAEGWQQRLVLDDTKRATKLNFVVRICGMLEQEKLIRLIENKKEIRTTKKLDDLMSHYFLNDSRINEINAIFKEEMQNAANQQS